MWRARYASNLLYSEFLLFIKGRRSRSFPMPRAGRPRISIGLRESKTLAIYNSGRSLLSERDYDAFSVAELAKGARCSVGAFYVRFADKDAFLGFLLAESFSSAAQALASALTSGNTKAVGMSAKAQLAVSLLIDQFAEDTFAGVVRAAIKLSLSNTFHTAPFEDFRSAVTDQLTEWLRDQNPRNEVQIRTALRIIFGALTDNTLSDARKQSIGTGVFRLALIHLLKSAVSGDLNSGDKTGGKKADQKRDRNLKPVSALEKPEKESVVKTPPAPARSSIPLPTTSNRTRKV
jgi:AcrR family transcriptional regulator